MLAMMNDIVETRICERILAENPHTPNFSIFDNQEYVERIISEECKKLGVSYVERPNKPSN